ncbi:MAG TPA: MFS transporter [bacterium]|nr:MFS transporter [bacterium]HPQ66831.1 MFS transporter [bacterium]
MIYLLAFLMNITTGLVNLANPLVALQRFGADPVLLGILGSGPSIVYALGCAGSGFWAARFRHRTLIEVSSFCLLPVFVSILWVRHFYQFFFLAAAFSLCASVFWPAMIRWVGTEREGNRLRRKVGNYNIAMIAGVMVGPLLGGVAISADYRYPYLLGAAAAGAVLGLLLLGRVRPRAPRPGSAGAAEAEEEGVPGFVYIGWAANFAAWFAIGLSQSLFPALGKSLAQPLGDRFLGILIALIAAGEIVVFVVLRRGAGWHYNFPLLCAFQALGAAGLLVLGLNSSPWLFVPGFLAVGLCGGMTYFSSIYYSVHGRGGGGSRSGFHESFLGLGVALGPIAGGLTAQGLGLRAPYFLGVAVFGAGICLQYRFLRAARRRAGEGKGR